MSNKPVPLTPQEVDALVARFKDVDTVQKLDFAAKQAATLAPRLRLRDLKTVAGVMQRVQTDIETGIGQLKQKLRATSDAMRVQRANLRRDAAHESGPLLDTLRAASAAVDAAETLGWDDPAWDTSDPAALHAAYAAGRPLPDRLYAGTIGVRTGSGLVTIPAFVPFIGRQRIVTLRSDKPESRLAMLQLLGALALRIHLTLPKMAEFVFLDPHNSGNTFQWANSFAKAEKTRDLHRRLDAIEAEFGRISSQYLDHKVSSFDQLAPSVRQREKLQIVCVADFPRGFDEVTAAKLLRFARNGMANGTYFLIHFDETAPMPRDIDLGQYPLWAPQQPATLGARIGEGAPDVLPTPARLESLLSRAAAFEPERAVLDISASGIGATDSWWSQDATWHVSAQIGHRGQSDPLTVMFGESRESFSIHGVLSATSGAGKSTLLHVLITTLACRYSPRELRFYLVDGKNGVEFAPYRSLPHAAVISLNTPPDLSRSLLVDLLEEMERRNALFRAHGVDGYRAFRERFPNETLPRLMLVIDEYQEVVEQDPDGDGSRRLIELAAKGRSAGIHLFCASQQFAPREMIGAREFMNNIHLRIAMKATAGSTGGITEFDAEGRQMIESLTAAGQVLVNAESGRAGHNVQGQVALLDRATRDDLIGKLREKAAQAGIDAVCVTLDGVEQPVFLETPAIARLLAGAPPDDDALAHLAATPERQGGFGLPGWHPVDRPVPVWLGRALDVHSYAAFALRRADDENVLIVGQNANARAGMMLATALSALAARGRAEVGIGVVDHGLAPVWRALRDTVCAPAGIEFDSGEDEAGTLALLQRWADEAARRASLDREGQHREPTRLLFVPDPLRTAGLVSNRSEQWGFEPSDAGRVLAQIVQNGPRVGLHVVMAIEQRRAFERVFDIRRQLDLFGHQVLMQMSADESLKLMGRPDAHALQSAGDRPVMALHHARGAGTSTVFKTYMSGDAPAVSPRENLSGALGAFAAALALDRTEEPA